MITLCSDNPNHPVYEVDEKTNLTDVLDFLYDKSEVLPEDMSFSWGGNLYHFRTSTERVQFAMGVQRGFDEQYDNKLEIHYADDILGYSAHLACKPENEWFSWWPYENVVIDGEEVGLLVPNEGDWRFTGETMTASLHATCPTCRKAAVMALWDELERAGEGTLDFVENAIPLMRLGHGIAVAAAMQFAQGITKR